MEFADRGSLADVLKAKAGSMMLFDEDAILDWFVQIVAALRAMHARSILHRDLKAANVFLTSRNLIKVGDFGISKMLEKNGGLASTTIGTPYYLAPEVINGEPYGLKADVWSLGVLLYEMMALRKPFEATTLPSLALKIVSTSYPPPPACFSSELVSVLSSMLQREPTARPSLDQLARHPLLRRHEARLQAQLRSLAALAMPGELPSESWANSAQHCSSHSCTNGEHSTRGNAETTGSPAKSERYGHDPPTPPGEAYSPLGIDNAQENADGSSVRRQSGSKAARQLACGLRMRLLADGTAPRHVVSNSDAAAGEQNDSATADAVQANLEKNLRFARNLQAVEFNLAAWESGDTLRSETKTTRKKGGMMPCSGSPLRESNTLPRK